MSLSRQTDIKRSSGRPCDPPDGPRRNAAGHGGPFTRPGTDLERSFDGVEAVAREYAEAGLLRPVCAQPRRGKFKTCGSRSCVTALRNRAQRGKPLSLELRAKLSAAHAKWLERTPCAVALTRE